MDTYFHMKHKTTKHSVLLTTVVSTVAVFSLTATTAVIAREGDDSSQPIDENETLTGSTTNLTSSATLITDNGTLDFQAIVTELIDVMKQTEIVLVGNISLFDPMPLLNTRSAYLGGLIAVIYGLWV
jgi:hypothetical protein